LKGIDTSYYDGGADNQGQPALNTIDWAEYARSGWPFAFIKVSEGTVADPLFSLQWEAARGNIYRGGYHFFRPDVDVARSVDKFIEYIGEDVGELPPVLDMESRYGINGDVVAARALEWLDLYEQAIGVKPIIYSGAGFLKYEIQAHKFPKFAEYELWLAQYYYDNMSDPARAEKIHRVLLSTDPITFPASPLPWSGIPTTFQWTGKGAPKDVPGYYMGYGAKRSVDFNFSVFKTYADFKGHYELGDLPTEPEDVATQPYDGVTTIEGVRHGVKFFIDLLDMSKVSLTVVHGAPLARPSEIARDMGAQLAYNGDDWKRDEKMPAGYAVSNGAVYKKKQSGEPSLFIRTDGSFGIDTQTTNNVLFATSGVRYIVQNGEISDRVLGTDPTSTEMHARKLVGLTADNRVMQFVCEGDYVYSGMQFKESAQIMLDYGCVTAIDGGGGGDVSRAKDGVLTIIPDDEYNNVHYERYVPQTILIFAKKNGETMPPVENGIAKEVRGRNGTVRKTPSRYGTYVTEVGANTEIAFVKVVPVEISGSADKPGDLWLELPDGNFLNHILEEEVYFEIIKEPTDPTDPPPDPTDPVYPESLENTLVIPKEDGTPGATYWGTLYRQDE